MFIGSERGIKSDSAPPAVSGPGAPGLIKSDIAHRQRTDKLITQPMPNSRGQTLIAMLKTRAVALATLDLRSLACFRIGLAAVLLLDLGLRARDLVAHYTQAGV